jgi:DNA-binding CsgD family transcriptional regulator
MAEHARALHEGAAPAVRPVVAAYEALCLAEGLRATGDNGARPGGTGDRDPGNAEPGGTGDRHPEIGRRRGGGAEPQAGGGDAEAWADAGKRWGDLDQPYPAAYARFREAEARLGRQARSARAAALLREAHEVATRLGAEPFRRQVEDLAGRARVMLDPPRPRVNKGHEEPRPRATTGHDGPRPSGATGPLAALSAREREVLELMVEGRTNKEIAAALFISEKTASVHVSHILAKLGVRSRVQAVALAHRQQG